jgi:hypothetical protein
MIKIVRNDEGNIIAKTDTNKGKINLCVGVGAYQITELTTEEARNLAMDLMMWASHLAEEKQQ